MPNPKADKNAGPTFIREWREFRKLSQTDLARRVGTNQNVIGYLESGERGLSLKWLRRISEALEVEPAALVTYGPEDEKLIMSNIWANASEEQRKRIIAIARALTDEENEADDDETPEPE